MNLHSFIKVKIWWYPVFALQTLPFVCPKIVRLWSVVKLRTPNLVKLVKDKGSKFDGAKGIDKIKLKSPIFF
jgi:hypothetical protein